MVESVCFISMISIFRASCFKLLFSEICQQFFRLPFFRFPTQFFILLGTELLGAGPKSKARGRARLRLEQVRLAKHLDRVSSHQIKLRDSCPRSDRATTPRSQNYNESTKFIDQERQWRSVAGHYFVLLCPPLQERNGYKIKRAFISKYALALFCEKQLS